jgi:uncharacterized damage-inducible protein DinB
MKELLKQYATYNIWASQKLSDIVLRLPEEKQQEEIASSFSSLHKTIFHMWDAESIWWQRMRLQEKIIVPSITYNVAMKEVVAGLGSQSKQWEEWIANASDLAIEHVFQYKRLDGTQYKQPIWQMLLHVFNHATYHRGQVVNMLRQLGVDKIPSTDFSTWAVGKK